MSDTIFSLATALLDAWEAPSGIVRMSKLERAHHADRMRWQRYSIPCAVESHEHTRAW